MIITTHKLNVKLKSIDKLIVVFRLNKCHSKISFFCPNFFWICRQITYLQFMTFLFGYLAICMFLHARSECIVCDYPYIDSYRACCHETCRHRIRHSIKIFKVLTGVRKTLPLKFMNWEKNRNFCERENSEASLAIFMFLFFIKIVAYRKSYWHVNQQNEIAHINFTLDLPFIVIVVPI